ncbi:metallophosphoesterase [Thalassobacillus sp. CUG 92003]|uniref:metallophosphoesterase n=1 Tax=Thalassobacillus sp. CUG 92003 TaxID=2736641 RepID=UPI0015E7304D|nr:metallophosphoesterase [Thalassobacillus sp. CUG 92003]
MPSVLIISDSHGLTQEVQDIKARHQQQVDAMIHCGDAELSLESEPLQGFYYAKGNCDFESSMENEQVFSVEGLTFLVTHGHLFQIKSTLMPLSYRAEQVGADVVCFGHSHQVAAEKVKNQFFINPGSSRLPRDRKEATYAILEWEGNDLTLHYYEVNGKPLESLRVDVTL